MRKKEKKIIKEKEKNIIYRKVIPFYLKKLKKHQQKRIFN